MPENQKDKKDGTVVEDQEEHGYYYDDAHGYEEFDPEAEEIDGEERDAEIERRGDAATRRGDAVTEGHGAR
jgi:hypothetical protein